MIVLSRRSVLLAMMGLLMGLGIVDAAQAQSLDQKVLGLLSNQCQGLGFGVFARRFQVPSATGE